MININIEKKNKLSVFPLPPEVSCPGPRAVGEDEDDERDEEKTASGGGYQVGAYGLSNGLREHISQYDEGHEWKAEYLPAQGC